MHVFDIYDLFSIECKLKTKCVNLNEKNIGENVPRNDIYVEKSP